MLEPATQTPPRSEQSPRRLQSLLSAQAEFGFATGAALARLFEAGFGEGGAGGLGGGGAGSAKATGSGAGFGAGFDGDGETAAGAG